MVRWGIIGCGGIARRMAGVLRTLPGAVLQAVAAREEDRARAFAADFAIPHAYGSYEALARDGEVDAVYVATIHPTHAAAVRTCLRAGKPVLCEKPLAMTAAQAAALYDEAAAKGLLLMEAMWTRYLPAWQAVRRLVDDGVIGPIRRMQADFSCHVDYDPASRLYAPELGGGALLDIGVYAAHMLLYILGDDYSDVKASGRRAPTGVDSFAAALIVYPSGAVGELTCAADCTGAQEARLYGKQGWIEIPHMFRADGYTVYREGEAPRERHFPIADGFEYEAEAFQRLLTDGHTASDVVTPQATIEALRLLERIDAQIAR